MNKIVKPRDLKVGDRIVQVDKDLRIVGHEIINVVVLRKLGSGEAKAYKVFLEGWEEPVVYRPRAEIEIE